VNCNAVFTIFDTVLRYLRFLDTVFRYLRFFKAVLRFSGVPLAPLLDVNLTIMAGFSTSPSLSIFIITSVFPQQSIHFLKGYKTQILNIILNLALAFYSAKFETIAYKRYKKKAYTYKHYKKLSILLGVANGKIETLRDGETSVFLCETETSSLFKLRDRDI